MNEMIAFWKEAAGILLPLTIFLAIYAAGILVKRVLFRRLERWAERTKTQADDILIAAIGGPFILWAVLSGIFVAARFSSLPPQAVAAIDKCLLVLAIFSFTSVLSRVSTGMISAYAPRIEGFIPATSLTENLSRIVIFGVGLLVILNTLGVSITPILATLGVGGLAVALALQDTLSNLFAGFHLSVARQIKIGNYIKLDTGEEGYVTDINWRATKIRMLSNNVVLVPNEKLTKAIITNYYLPEREMAVLVNLSVHYNSDLKKVERVTCEAAKETMREVSGGIPEFDPFIRYNLFGDSGIHFTVVLRAREFTDQYLIQHEFIKRLHERYRKEGIVIPYPIRAINNDQEKGR